MTSRLVSRSFHAWLLLCLGTVVSGQDRGLTPEDVARIKGVTAAVISPDGIHVAYTLSVPRSPTEETDGGAWSELWVVDGNGNSRSFVSGEVNVSSPQWMPDGSAVTYLARRNNDKTRCLYSIPIDGGESTKVLSHTTSVGTYSWHPSGERIAFLAAGNKNPRSKTLRAKGFDAEIYEENLISTGVWIRDLSRGGAPRLLELPGSATDPLWSPDGKRLALCLAPTPLIDDHYMKRRLHIVDPESGEVIARFSNPGKIGQVAWSGDGKNIAFISAEDPHDPSEGRLMIAPASGGGMKDIMPGLEGHIESIAWSKGNIFALVDEGVTTRLLSIDREGKTSRTIFPSGRRPMHGISQSSTAPGMAMISDGPDHAAEVFAMNQGDLSPRRLTNSNPWLDKIRLAPQEVVRYKARDGLMIEGILIRPLDEKKGRRYPLVLAVHGGPEAHIQNGWLSRYSYPGQVGAARGFATFYPNYRGSTGRGVEFSKMGQGDYGGKEFDDLVDAVDHFISTGLADEKKIGITGGSYGGFASAWCATRHSERFAASVMFVGISNQISKSGTTDIPEEMFLVHARKRLWDDWQFFLERSPLYYVEKARTPLLIMHGKNDPRVHPSQSMELYRHLKTLGKTPVRLVFYPGEGHGNRRAASRYDYNLRMMRWFEHYLLGPGGDPPGTELKYGKVTPAHND